jgi:hypothetical protein
MITEPDAERAGDGVGLPQPVQRRSVKLPGAAHGVQVLCPTNALQRARPTAMVEARQRCEV